MPSIEVLCTRYGKLAGGGVSLGFRVHSDDANLVHGIEPNRRYALALVEIGEDEKLVQLDKEEPYAVIAKDRSNSKPARLSYPQRAGILSKDPLFRMWLSETKQKTQAIVPFNEIPAQRIREYCNVESLSDIKPDSEQGTRLDFLESAFMAWRDGPRHGA